MLPREDAKSTFFPSDIIKNISMYLETKYLPQIMLVDKHFHETLNSNSFWNQKKSEHLPEALKTFLAKNSLSHNFSKDANSNKDHAEKFVETFKDMIRNNKKLPGHVLQEFQEHVNKLKNNIDHPNMFIALIHELYPRLSNQLSEKFYNDYLKFIVYHPFSFDLTYDKTHERIKIVIKQDDLIAKDICMLGNAPVTLVLYFKKGQFQQGTKTEPAFFDGVNRKKLYEESLKTKDVVANIIGYIKEFYLQTSTNLKPPEVNQTPKSTFTPK